MDRKGEVSNIYTKFIYFGMKSLVVYRYFSYWIKLMAF